MPALSPTMTQGNVGVWKKKVGDEINPGDAIVEIETDKAQMDFECQEEGYLAQTFLSTGSQDVLVGTPLCILAENKADVAAFAEFTTADIGGAAPTPAAAAPAAAAPTPKAAAAPASNAASFPPHTLMGMPALSPTMTIGNIGTWKKNVGDRVQPGESLVEIETDKALMDFECQEEGYVAKIFVESGAKDVDVGTPICILVEDEADVAKFASYSVGAAAAEANADAAASSPVAFAAAAASSAAAPVAARKSGERVIASPAAKFIAAQKGLNLESIVGTGPHGRILKGDVLAFKGVAAPKAAAAAAAPSTAASFAPAPVTAQTYIDTPVSGIRKVIAARLTESKQSIPHYYLSIEFCADTILALRQSLNAQADGKYKLSVNDFVIKASALALRDVPAVNSAWQGSFIREFQTSDIAIAVATPSGLITPIVATCESKGLSVISNSVKELAGKARDGKLQPHEYQGGSFTISNLGMFGVKSFTAIINPPHAAILAVGGVEEKVVVDAKAAHGFRAQKMVTVTLSADHRVVDGAVGAQWLQAFKKYIENPVSMIL
ncbi:hypothetical protein HDU98_008330 [Podochytrium sp. JEL0797]|nr:hypothetical protein HDU98_008330 [Podochytrium sp. JEL0797]